MQTSAIPSAPSVHARRAHLVVDSEPVELTYQEHDGARPYLLLHGGGGPGTVAAFGALLASRKGARVLLPTHPGFAGTPRPETLASVAALARLYQDLLESLDLTGVTVIGNSLGGWIAAEMALADRGRVGAVVLVNGVGVVVPGHPITDVSKLTPQELAARAFHRPELQPKRPEGAPPPAPDLAALAAYAGRTMSDESLRARLDRVALPVHVIWGESDRIVDVAYGRAFASAIRGSTFTLLPEAGHLPQVEAPERLLAALPEPPAR